MFRVQESQPVGQEPTVAQMIRDARNVSFRKKEVR